MRVLIAEDDPALATFVQKGLEAEHYAVDVTHDGEQAKAMATELDYDLFMLDLNLPRMDGREVLLEIKSDPKLKTIPVVVLTTSRAEHDVLRSYELQANCYITKPVDLEQFITVVKSIEDFWFTVVTLPHIT